MDFEALIQRLIDGLTIISQYIDPDTVEVAAHSYSIMVPGLTYANFSDDEVEELKEKGWSWNDEMGWILPTVA